MFEPINISSFLPDQFETALQKLETLEYNTESDADLAKSKRKERAKKQMNSSSDEGSDVDISGNEMSLPDFPTLVITPEHKRLRTPSKKVRTNERFHQSPSVPSTSKSVELRTPPKKNRTGIF